MTYDEIKARIAGTAVHDPEAAHADEDALYLDTLRAIADGAENPQKLAKWALVAAGIPYTRWYA